VAITTYTTYAEVRAALGVTEEELSDATLALDFYAYSLDIEVSSIDSGLPAQFAVVEAIAAGSRTAAQAALFAAMKVFAPYAVAVQLASSLPLFAPKSITDGKASLSRDSSAPYAKTIEKCRANYERFRAILDAAYVELNGGGGAVAVLPFLSVVSPASDPVTGV
jgi:hypothetical protein